MSKQAQLDQLVAYYANGYKAEFARKLGITKQCLNSWYKNEYINIEKVFHVCPGVSAEWLITGNGPMIIEPPQEVNQDEIIFPTETAKRLNAILEYYHLKANVFGARIGLKRAQAIYDIQSGKTKSFSKGMSSMILTAYPEINIVWLLTGEGTMFGRNKAIPENKGNQEAIEALKLLVSELKKDKEFLIDQNKKLWQQLENKQ